MSTHSRLSDDAATMIGFDYVYETAFEAGKETGREAASAAFQAGYDKGMEAGRMMASKPVKGLKLK